MPGGSNNCGSFEEKCDPKDCFTVVWIIYILSSNLRVTINTDSTVRFQIWRYSQRLLHQLCCWCWLRWVLLEAWTAMDPKLITSVRVYYGLLLHILLLRSTYYNINGNFTASNTTLISWFWLFGYSTFLPRWCNRLWRATGSIASRLKLSNTPDRLQERTRWSDDG